MPRAWDRLERFMRWEHKKKYGQLPSEGELKKVKGELYASETMRRNMERAGATMPGGVMQGGVKVDGKRVKEFLGIMEDRNVNEFLLAVFIGYSRKMSSLELRVLDGADCIGGNKIAVSSGGEAVLLDFGINMKRKRDYLLGYRALAVANTLYYYLYSGVLPRIRGIYRADLIAVDERVRAILEKGEEVEVAICIFSHSHRDHYGASGFLSEDVTLATSRSMKTIMEAMLESSAASGIEAEVFAIRNRGGEGREFRARPTAIFEEYSKVSGAPFHITPCPIDHSVPAAFGFVIEDLSLAYTGDIRRHGALKNLTDRFIEQARGVDYLIIEGTRIDSSIMIREDEVVWEISRYVKEKKGKLICIIVSPADVDRIRSIVQLSRELGRIPVLCPRAAYLIDRLAESGTKIPLPDLRDAGIYFERRSLTGGGYDLESQHYRGWLRKTYTDRLDGKRPGVLVKAEEISEKQENYLLILGGLDQVLELVQIRPRPGSGLVVSTSEPHDEEQEIEWAKFERWVNLLRLDLRIAHSSGHADRESLIGIINEIGPRILIPVHTENPQEFHRLAETGEIRCEVILPSPIKPIRLTS